MQTIQARWFHEGRLKPIRLVVIHATVSGDSSTGAEAVAAYFKRGERRASAHRVCDNNSTVLCVKDEDTAFGAAGANSDGLHLELVGRPEQTLAQWLDPFGDAMLREAGSTIREWCTAYDLPMRWLSIAEVADGRTRGLCTHADVSKAFPAVSTGHWDPGPDFPKDEALRLWRVGEEDEVTPEDILKIAEAVTVAQQPQMDALRQRLNDVQTNLAALQRRVLGVPLMADSAEQHKADSETGRRFQELLG